jgi:hypothetical protein
MSEHGWRVFLPNEQKAGMQLMAEQADFLDSEPA